MRACTYILLQMKVIIIYDLAAGEQIWGLEQTGKQTNKMIKTLLKLTIDAKCIE